MLTGFVTGTVGRVLAQTGDPVPQSGRVEFTAEVDDHPAGDALIISDRVVCQLDAQGRILDPTDPEGTRLGVELDASENIQAGFAYLVEIIGDSFDTRRFRIVVHANQTTDIATAVRVPAQPATVISTLQALIDTITDWISDPEFLRGAKGDEGDQGPAGVITEVTATALPPGSPPTVTLGGTPEARTIALGIPAGAKGDEGIQGDSGVSVSGAEVTDTGRLIITLTSGQQIDAGRAWAPGRVYLDADRVPYMVMED